MELITGKDWVYIIFGAGGVISTISYLMNSFKELKRQMTERNFQMQKGIETTNEKVHHLEITTQKIGTTLEMFIHEMRRNMQEIKDNNNAKTIL